MAIARGGQRRAGSYKVITDTAVRSTMVVDVTGGVGGFYGLECVTGGTTIMIRFYDSTTAVAGTTVPLFSFLVPASSTFSVNIPEGIPFVSGLSYNATQTDSDPATTTNPSHDSTIYIYTT